MSKNNTIDVDFYKMNLITNGKKTLFYKITNIKSVDVSVEECYIVTLDVFNDMNGKKKITTETYQLYPEDITLIPFMVEDTLKSYIFD